MVAAKDKSLLALLRDDQAQKQFQRTGHPALVWVPLVEVDLENMVFGNFAVGLNYFVQNVHELLIDVPEAPQPAGAACAASEDRPALVCSPAALL